MRMWWNWYTRAFEGRMPQGLRVQIPPSAHCALSSVVEHLIDVERVVGSNPTARTDISIYEN